MVNDTMSMLVPTTDLNSTLKSVTKFTYLVPIADAHTYNKFEMHNTNNFVIMASRVFDCYITYVTFI